MRASRTPNSEEFIIDETSLLKDIGDSTNPKEAAPTVIRQHTAGLSPRAPLSQQQKTAEKGDTHPPAEPIVQKEAQCNIHSITSETLIDNAEQSRSQPPGEDGFHPLNPVSCLAKLPTSAADLAPKDRNQASPVKSILSHTTVAAHRGSAHHVESEVPSRSADVSRITNAAKPDQIKDADELIPHGPDLGDGALGTPQLSEDTPHGSDERRGNGRMGIRPRKSKEQKQAEKDRAAAAQAALDRGEELPREIQLIERSSLPAKRNMEKTVRIPNVLTTVSLNPRDSAQPSPILGDATVAGCSDGRPHNASSRQTGLEPTSSQSPHSTSIAASPSIVARENLPRAAESDPIVADTQHDSASGEHAVSIPTTSSSTEQAVPRTPSKKWTAEEDAILVEARKKGMDWDPIAVKYFPTQSGNSCRKRHERIKFQPMENHCSVEGAHRDGNDGSDNIENTTTLSLSKPDEVITAQNSRLSDKYVSSTGEQFDHDPDVTWPRLIARALWEAPDYSAFSDEVQLGLAEPCLKYPVTGKLSKTWKTSVSATLSCHFKKLPASRSDPPNKRCLWTFIDLKKPGKEKAYDPPPTWLQSVPGSFPYWVPLNPEQAQAIKSGQLSQAGKSSRLRKPFEPDRQVSTFNRPNLLVDTARKEPGPTSNVSSPLSSVNSALISPDATVVPRTTRRRTDVPESLKSLVEADGDSRTKEQASRPITRTSDTRASASRKRNASPSTGSHNTIDPLSDAGYLSSKRQRLERHSNSGPGVTALAHRTANRISSSLTTTQAAVGGPNSGVVQVGYAELDELELPSGFTHDAKPAEDDETYRDAYYKVSRFLQKNKSKYAVRDFYATQADDDPLKPAFDYEAKMSEIRARPGRKTAIGNPLSRLLHRDPTNVHRETEIPDKRQHWRKDNPGAEQGKNGNRKLPRKKPGTVELNAMDLDSTLGGQLEMFDTFQHMLNMPTEAVPVVDHGDLAYREVATVSSPSKKSCKEIC